MDNLGCLPKTNLEDGISRTIKWFRENRSFLREK